MVDNPISKVFTNLNRGPWIHRAQWIDKMAKYDLIDSNVVSWNQEYINVKMDFMSLSILIKK